MQINNYNWLYWRIEITYYVWQILVTVPKVASLELGKFTANTQEHIYKASMHICTENLTRIEWKSYLHAAN